MPDTYISGGSRASANHIRDGWDDTHKPALDRIERAACALLDALDAMRLDLMLAKDIEALDAFACDTGGRAIDLIQKLTASQRDELESRGGARAELHIDLSVLEDEHAIWEARWNARKPPKVEA